LSNSANKKSSLSPSVICGVTYGLERVFCFYGILVLYGTYGCVSGISSFGLLLALIFFAEVSTPLGEICFSGLEFS
jgi:hypothetical protein